MRFRQVVVKPKFWFFLLKAVKKFFCAQARRFSLSTRFPTCYFEESVFIFNEANLTLGTKVLIKTHAQLHCGSNDGFVSIGSESTISEGSVIYGHGGVTIGSNVSFGPNVCILSMHEDYSRKYSEEKIADRPKLKSEIVIGNNVILYSNVTVCQGVTIGDGAIVGANSLVLRDVKPWTVVAGSPAKYIKDRK